MPQMPFIRRHHLMFQHDNIQLYVARICTLFREAENVPVLLWPAYSPDMSPTEDQHVRQRGQSLKRSGTAFHRPQSTAWSTLCEGDVSRWMRKMVVTPEADWFSDQRPYLFLRYLWPTDAYLYSQLCEIHRLRPNEFMSIVWFPYMNCNSVKSLKLLNVAFIFLFSAHEVGGILIGENRLVVISGAV